jgi:hypothetical protein
MEIAGALVAATQDEIEDGIYKLVINGETIGASIPRIFAEQREDALPGFISRITGINLIRLSGGALDATTFKVEKGLIVEYYAVNTNQRGSVESSEAAPENS